MLYTIDEWRETGCFTPFMNGEKRNAYTIDEWRETGCFTPLMNGEKRNVLHH